jgi:hypothetical protein
MHRSANPHPLLLAALAAGALSACNEGPRIEARPQVITFAPAPSPAVNQPTATVSATASSGLPVRYTSRTAFLCSVDPESGVVTATVAGTCTIAAGQAGDATFAAAFPATQDVAFRFQGVITFDPAPSLRVHDLGTVRAVESTGLSIGYGSATPGTCSVDRTTGLVVALAASDCTIVASAGDLQSSQTFAIAAPLIPTVPGAPSGVTAAAGSAPATVRVQFGGVQAGGSPVTGYVVSSSPPGVTASSATAPIIAACPASCTGYRFSVAATNALGPGPASGAADMVTGYHVVAVFREPDTQPNDSVFVGTYTFNASTGVVSGLRGRLSESMTGGSTPFPNDTMTWLDLGQQLSALPVTLDGADGWLVTTFRLGVTDTLSSDPKFGGTDGWEPGTGSALHWGFPGPNPGNAYVRIFVDAAEPATAPTPGQLAKLAYADCAPGGMMGEMCMTGTSVAGYGKIGSMGGYPLSQVTTRR